MYPHKHICIHAPTNTRARRQCVLHSRAVGLSDIVQMVPPRLCKVPARATVRRRAPESSGAQEAGWRMGPFQRRQSVGDIRRPMADGCDTAERTIRQGESDLRQTWRGPPRRSASTKQAKLKLADHARAHVHPQVRAAQRRWLPRWPKCASLSRELPTPRVILYVACSLCDIVCCIAWPPTAAAKTGAPRRRPVPQIPTDRSCGAHRARQPATTRTLRPTVGFSHARMAQGRVPRRRARLRACVCA